MDSARQGCSHINPCLEYRYLPTTEYSLIWKGQYKLMTNAGGSGWYHPTLTYNDTHDPPNSDEKEWPCVAPVSYTHLRAHET